MRVEIVCLFLFFILKLNSQNLISNSSFSNVKEKKNKDVQYQLLPGELSDIKHWYLPEFINYRKHHLVSQFTSLYGSTYYFTSRDKDLFIKNRQYTNSDQLFENNMGHIFLHVNYLYPKAVIQQKLNNKIDKGRYCFKFKYKFVKGTSKGHASLEFCLSSTDLKEFYTDKLKVPKNIINIDFRDTLTDGDKNTPWQQKSYVLDLKGNESYLTIGGLSNPKNFSNSDYYIDDIELYRLSDSILCDANVINKNLRLLYPKEFLLDEIVSNDTLIMFKPLNGFVPGIISPDAKEYLMNIIAFMQRHPDIKIKFIEYVMDVNPTLKPFNCDEFIRYLIFFDIARSRISTELKLCYDPEGVYCGKFSEFAKIGFMFYR